jgi:hypothetical protein
MFHRKGDWLQQFHHRGLPGGHRQGSGTPFECRHPLFENIGGRIHDPGVDVARFLQSEQVRRMFGIAEHEGGGLINGHRPGPGCRVGIFLAGMQRQSIEASVGHVLSCS